MNVGNNDNSIAASRYYSFAGKDVDVWRSIVGLRVKHSTLEYGIVSEVTQNDNGNIYVWVNFDSLVQSRASEGVTNLLQFPTEVFNGKVTELRLPADLLVKVENYERDLLQAEKQRKATEARAEQEALLARQNQISQKHREHMQKYGLPYQGERRGSARTLRETHCWQCKKPIDNVSFLECATCGWIICQCGACGCGYSQK